MRRPSFSLCALLPRVCHCHCHCIPAGAAAALLQLAGIYDEQNTFLRRLDEKERLADKRNQTLKILHDKAQVERQQLNYSVQKADVMLTQLRKHVEDRDVMESRMRKELVALAMYTRRLDSRSTVLIAALTGVRTRPPITPTHHTHPSHPLCTSVPCLLP